MDTLIREKLMEIEHSEKCRILLAVESGSRAWGFPSPDSDYDVRFIYVRPIEHYLKLEQTRDVIELPINDLLDMNGWDLKKALCLLHRSNPTVFEWFSCNRQISLRIKRPPSQRISNEMAVNIFIMV